MSEETETRYRVGTEFAFQHGIPLQWHILAVTKITPTGRMTCGPFTLNPDLSVRGKRTMYGPRYAVVATPDIHRAVARQNNVRMLRRVLWSEVSDVKVQAIARILQTESTS